ncbi:MAG: class I SAM-dependent methyltransferase [Fibrobacterota bacterium]
MAESRLIIHEFSGKYNQKELYYMDNTMEEKDEFKDIHDPEIRYADGRLVRLKDFFKWASPSGRCLELGAGSCWVSSMLSRLDEVSEVYALEISRRSLVQVAPRIMDMLDADKEKITRVLGDFNRLDFPDDHFDFVVFDAALHHIPTRDFSKIMSQVKRILRPKGKIIAVNEPFLPDLPIIREKKRRDFGADEKEHGIIENSYSLSEWRELFADSGFKTFFKEYIPEFKNDSIKRKVKKAVLSGPLRNIYFRVFPPHYFIVADR